MYFFVSYQFFELLRENLKQLLGIIQYKYFTYNFYLTFNQHNNTNSNNKRLVKQFFKGEKPEVFSLLTLTKEQRKSFC